MRFWRAAPFVLMVLLAAVPADASDRLPVAGVSDFWFEFAEPSVLTARTYAQEFGIDSMLWLYDANGQAVTANDDWFGLDSYLNVPVEAGVYRVRAGVCCGNPNRWYGQSYEIEFNNSPQLPTTTTSVVETTTTVQESTTTTVVDEPTTTTTVEETTTTSTEPETTTSTTTTEPEPTTTTSTTTTTTEPPAPPVIIPPTPETTWPTTTSPATTTTVPPPTSTEPAVTEPPATEPATTVAVDTTVATTTSAPAQPVSSTAPPVPATSEPAVTEPPLAPESPSETSTTTILPAPPADATDAEKQAFEAEVNVFSGAYDNYVPAGSTVTVAQRRTIVAATIAISTVLPGPAPTRRKK